MTILPQNPDVIVIGAGVAGLSAATALKGNGKSVLVLEADDHIGGRCITDTNSFSVPFDRGGSWLHSAPINPLARVAEHNTMRLHKAPWNWSSVQIMGKTLSKDETEDYRVYQSAMWENILTADTARSDSAISTLLPDGPWRNTAQHSIAQMLSADADVVSAQDSTNYAHAEGDWLVEGGLGAFISRQFGDVPVRCGCPVSKIDYSGQNVVVSSALGTIEAPHAIITVSTSGLASGAIEFVPELPVPKQEAIDMLPCGLLNKVAIEFEPGWHAATEGQMVDYHSGDTEFCSILFGFFGTGLATGFLAGRFADQIEHEGPGAATEYVREALRAFFGNDVDKSIVRTGETAWRQNPYTIGSYSFARPGGTGLRAILSDPLNERLYFAGEATMTNTYSTVHGAYLSGQKAASDICRLDKNHMHVTGTFHG